VDHYQDLLRATGSSFDEMVRGVYRSRTDYLLFCNRLGQVERRFNAALRPGLSDNSGSVAEIIARMEQGCDSLRRAHCERVFP
jgi:hypothetical protein